MSSILSYIAISLSLLLLLTKLLLSSSSYSKKFKNLPPSPPNSLPIIGHLHLLKTPLYRTLSHLSSLHGPILLLRFGPRPVLLISSLSLSQQCFTKHDIVFANRPHLHSTRHLSNNYTSLSTASYGPHWRNLRRVAVLHIFSSSRIHSLSYDRYDEVCSLVRSLFRLCCNWEGLMQKVELKSRLFELVLNVMMGMIAGKRYYGESEADAEEAKRFKEIVEEGFSLVGTSNIGDFLPVLRWIDFKGVEKRLVGLKERRDVFLQALIEEHRMKGCCDEVENLDGEKEKMRKSLISVMLSLQEEDPVYYTDGVIRSIMSVSGLLTILIYTLNEVAAD